MSDEQNYYDLLGVSRGESDLDVIKEARNKLIFEYHPDHVKNKAKIENPDISEEDLEELINEATKKTAEVNLHGPRPVVSRFATLRFQAALVQNLLFPDVRYNV